MNIFKKDVEDKKYANAYRRSLAAGIDIWIVLFMRVFVMQLLGILWINQAVMNFMEEFRETFGTEVIKNTPEHIDFVIHHRIFIYALIFYALVILVGTFYHACLNSSAWQGTIGKRLMKILITKEDGAPLTLNRGIAHYFLSVLPFAYLLFLVSFQVKNNLTFYQAVTASELNIFLGVMFVAWVQVHLFTKRKTTAYDLICDTVLVNGKTSAKWPWSKKVAEIKA